MVLYSEGRLIAMLAIIRIVCKWNKCDRNSIKLFCIINDNCIEFYDTGPRSSRKKMWEIKCSQSFSNILSMACHKFYDLMSNKYCSLKWPWFSHRHPKKRKLWVDLSLCRLINGAYTTCPVIIVSYVMVVKMANSIQTGRPAGFVCACYCSCLFE